MAKIVQRNMLEIDKALKAHADHGMFRRYRSLTGFLTEHYPNRDFDELFPVTDHERTQFEKHCSIFREKYTRLMAGKFGIPKLARTESGFIFNIDEAYAGETSCFRRFSAIKRAPLRIGINVSRDRGCSLQLACRAGALLAIYDLCKKRGQQTEVELCYGAGLMFRSHKKVSHIRIGIPSNAAGIMKTVGLSAGTIATIGNPWRKVCREHYKCESATYGFYRFSEFEEDPGYPTEYDFVLDRVETNSLAEEEARVIDRLKKLGLS